jgi:hypothetical protein
MFGGRGITASGMGKIIENVGLHFFLFINDADYIVQSITARRLLMLSLLALKTFLATLVCGRLSGRCLRTLDCNRSRACVI